MKIRILFDILQPNDKLIIVFIEIHLICIPLYLLQLLFAANLIDKVLIVAIVALLILLVLILVLVLLLPTATVRQGLRVVFLISGLLLAAHDLI